MVKAIGASVSLSSDICCVTGTSAARDMPIKPAFESCGATAINIPVIAATHLEMLRIAHSPFSYRDHTGRILDLSQMRGVILVKNQRKGFAFVNHLLGRGAGMNPLPAPVSPRRGFLFKVAAPGRWYCCPRRRVSFCSGPGRRNSRPSGCAKAREPQGRALGYPTTARAGWLLAATILQMGRKRSGYLRFMLYMVRERFRLNRLLRDA
jgi:hypothetical protein